MGRSALTSHSKGKRHVAKVNGRTSMSTLFFKNVVPTPSTEDIISVSVTSPNSATSLVSTATYSAVKPKTQATIASLCVKTNVTQAEILWVLKTVISHHSIRSCEGISNLFGHMFSDSEIAKSFAMSRTKCTYYVNYGIAPYFQGILLNQLQASPYFVVSYDESMNRILQEEQMDVLVRFFNEESGLVETRYFDSTFLRRPNSTNLHAKLLESLSTIPLNKMLQLSMDGPNVNWDVLLCQHQYRTEKEFPDIIIIGSCGLHILHGALKTGVKSTNWELDKILKAMWRLLYDSPARRDIYIKETMCDIWPLSFCGTRWVEDGPVAEQDMAKYCYYYQILAISM